MTNGTRAIARNINQAAVEPALHRGGRNRGLLAALVFGLLVSVGGISQAAVDTSAPSAQPQGNAVNAPSTAKQPSAVQATKDAYAQREASTTDVGDFAGGGAGIYIGGSSAALVLLIVLIIVIL